MRRTLFIIIPILILLHGNIQAQPYCDVRQFSMRDGLAANVISGLQQTRDSLMWFATWNGLCCYDGYRFLTFRDNPGKDEVLTTNRIGEIEPNINGDIWCVTYDRRLYLFSTKTSTYTDVSKMIVEKFGVNINVRRVYTLKNGYTWVLCNNDDVSIRINDNKVLDGGGLELYNTRNHMVKGPVVNKAFLDQKNREWLFSNKGLTLVGGKINSYIPFEYLECVGNDVILSSKNGKLASFHPGNPNPKLIKLPSEVSRINSMMLDRGVIYCGTDAGILTYDTRTKKICLKNVQHPMSPSPEVVRIYADSGHSLWAFTTGSGVLRIDSKTWQIKWLQAKLPEDASTGCTQPFFHEDNNHTVWVIPSDGTFSYYDAESSQLIAYPIRIKGFGYNNLPTLDFYRQDVQGNLWVVCMHDLNIINFKYRDFKKLPMGNKVEVRALFRDSGNRLWLGDAKGNVTIFREDGTLEGYLTPNGKISSVKKPLSNKIYCIYEDRRHRFWIGTKGMGLYVYDNGKVRHFTHDESDRASVSSDDIYCFREDSRGRMWIGTHGGGVNIVDEKGDKVSFVNSGNYLKGYPYELCQKVRRIQLLNDGTMLISTTGGLIVTSDRFKGWQPKWNVHQHMPNDTTTLLASDVMQTLLASDGNIYVNTLSGGVQYIPAGEINGGRLRFRQIKNLSLSEGNAHSMIEDKLGNLWIIHEAGIVEMNLKSGQIHQFGPNELGDKIEFSEAQPSLNKRTGEIFIGAVGSAVGFIPGKVRHNDYVPNIVFTSILYSGEQEAHPILETSLLEIPSDRRNVSISFSALDYTDNSFIRYAYKLEGEDKDWVYLSSSHTASFNNLPHGKYRLLVKSTNAEGVWQNNVKVLNIYAHPTFWESIWGKLLIALIAGGVFYAALYVYNLRKNATLERRMHEMKTRFFTNVGHKIRTPLTLIGGPVQQVLSDDTLTDSNRNYLEMVLRNSRNMLGLVDQMLDADGSDKFLVDDDNAPVFFENGNVDKSENVSASVEAIRLLVVEDNVDLRRFLVSILKRSYRIMEASNGREGLNIAIKEIPDFILTDVMMPVMDGLTMVHEIKQNKDICHIPIIVLSAKASLNDRLEGIREGIDDYITKPFSATYLKQRIENIVSQRRLLQQKFMQQIGKSVEGLKEDVVLSSDENEGIASADERRTRVHIPEDVHVESPQIEDADKQMIQHLMQFLEKNIGNSELRIEDMAASVHLGRTVFYEKIKSITGSTPIDFLRYFRIQRAEELIRKTKMPFSQIAYSVGFRDAKYFSTSFKRETGMTPSEYRNSKA